MACQSGRTNEFAGRNSGSFAGSAFRFPGEYGLSDMEGVSAIHVITPHSAGKEAMAFLREQLDVNHLHIRRLEMHPFGNDLFEFEAVIAASSTDAKVLDRLVETISAAPWAVQALWSRGATG